MTGYTYVSWTQSFWNHIGRVRAVGSAPGLYQPPSGVYGASWARSATTAAVSSTTSVSRIGGGETCGIVGFVSRAQRTGP